MSEKAFVNSSSKWSVPAHVTGFFKIVDDNDPLKKGSKGAGFSFNRYITTQIIEKSIKGTSIEVYFNDKKIKGEVSNYVASTFSSFCEGKNVKILHKSELPVSGGFGTSGAGALGTAYAMNEIFSTRMSPERLGQIAHKAEVKNNTGLGDVISQTFGGSEIRIKAGAPGIGQIMKFNWPKSVRVLIAYFGTLSTKQVITNNQFITKINNASIPLIESFLLNPTVEKFAEYSYEFAKQLNLMSTRVSEVLLSLNKNYLASMVMIGESIFVLGSKSELESCELFIKDKYPNVRVWITELADKGPRRLEELN